MSLIIPEQVMTVQFTPQRWGKDTRTSRKAPSDQTGPHAKGRGNYECLYEALTAHLKSITCPCRASPLFLNLFFLHFNLLCAALSFTPMWKGPFSGAVSWIKVFYHRITDSNRCVGTKRESCCRICHFPRRKTQHISVSLSFSPRVLLMVCKLPPLHPRGMDWTIRGRGSLVIQGWPESVSHCENMT